MGSGASKLSKSVKEPLAISTPCNESKQLDKYDKCDLEDLFAVNADNSLVDLPKQALILKIRQMQLELGLNTNNSNRAVSKIGLIPRSIFSEFDSSQTESIRAKDVLIYKLEIELQSQKRLFETQKLQTKQKLATYAAEITDLRFKSNKRISELETELKKQNNSSNSNDHQNPLIMKLSQKITEQVQIIHELEISLNRKNEIIEGFKLFESNQYDNLSVQSPDCQKSSKNHNFGQKRLSKNTRSFINQDMATVDSVNKSVELSMSNETFFCVEQLLPTKYMASKPKVSTAEIEFHNDKSEFVNNIKNLVSLSKDVNVSGSLPQID